MRLAGALIAALAALTAAGQERIEWGRRAAAGLGCVSGKGGRSRSAGGGAGAI
jgi:hypothetical protein